jgi:fatty acid amide hydrolase 2
MSDLWQLSATALAALIRARKVSPVEVVDTHIDRIEAVNGAINALVGPRFDEARDEARAAEDHLARTRNGEGLPPLFGVPCTIKEFIGVAGMPQTGGIVVWEGRKAEVDAPLVARLRAAGAIILGVTNVPEGGMWYETNNRIYGRTNNPWSLRRTAGGSSGGEAALIAAGGSPFGIGSDVGGSIRTPSAFCGTVGHKPTGRLVPNTGHFPPPHSEIFAYLTCGPIARRVADLLPILRIIAGPDPGDPLAVPWPQLAENDPIDLRDVVVYPLEDNGRTRIGQTMRHAVRRAAAALAARGARFGTLSAPKLRHAFEIWGAMMSAAAGASYAEVLGGGTPIKAGRELLRWTVGRSRHTLPALVLTLLERLPAAMGGRFEAMAKAGPELRAELESALGPRGVLLHPPYSRPAPIHSGALLTPLDFICTGIFNVLEFPVTQVPVGFDPRGLPVGVQVAGRRGNDRLTIAVAAAIEDELGGWVLAHPPRALPRFSWRAEP